MFRALVAPLRFVPLLVAFTAAAATNVIQYTYDAAGNITQVQRQTGLGLAITSFSPESGPVGTTVTIYGSGFSSTPANNAVSFNGTAAAVSASDSGSISTTVPSGATTGRISITVGTSTVTSTKDFTVVVPGAPVITSFSPSSGVAGTSVDVAGSGFDPASGATTVKLNGSLATSQVTDSNHLSFTVPGATASGRITASTALGTGASAQDFIVPPPGFAASDFVTTAHVQPDQDPVSISVFTIGKSSLLLFDGTAGGYYTIQLSPYTISPSNASIAYKVFKPDNTLLTSGSQRSDTASLFLPVLPTTGTYSVTFSPVSATLGTNVKVVTDPVLPIDGASVAFASTAVGQSTRMLILGTAGQYLGLGGSSISFSPPSTGYATVSVLRPDGTQLGYVYCYSSNPGCEMDLPNLPTMGTYQVTIGPPAGNGMAITTTLSSDITGSLTLGTPVALNIARSGQNARYTFTANAGDSLGVKLANVATSPPARSVTVKVLTPSGTIQASATAQSGNGAYINLPNIASSGTYTVLVSPDLGVTATAQLDVESGPVLQVDGSPQAFQTAVSSDTVRMTFTATAGQSLGLGLSSLTYAGTGSGNTSMAVARPDGSSVGSTTCNPSSPGGECRLTLTNLSQSGVYSIALTPPPGVTIGGSLWLSNDVAGTLSAGVPIDANVARVGQNGRFTFSGTAGSSVGIEIANIATNPASRSVSLTIYKPDGSYLNRASGTVGAYLDFTNLPSTGTYTALVETDYGATTTFRIKLDPGATLVLDGSSQVVSTSVVGETARLVFQGTAGARNDIGVSSLTYSPSSSGPTYYSVHRPDGPSLPGAEGSCVTGSGGGCVLYRGVLPVSGTYDIYLTPPTNVTASATLTLSTPIAGTIGIGDPPIVESVSRPGQSIRLTFTGAAGQTLRLNWTGASVTPNTGVGVTVVKPNGTNLSTASFSNGASSGLDIASLPTAGTYTIALEPSYGALFSVSIQLVTR